MGNIDDDDFETIESLNVARAFHSATELPDARVLVAGGTYGGVGDESNVPGFGISTPDLHWEQSETGALASIADVEIYNALDNLWSTTSPLIEPRSSHCALCLNNGQVMIIAGSGTQGALRSVELYTANDDRWTATAALSTPRFAHTATLLNNGHVMVCGGNNLQQGVGQILDSVEIYDPVHALWNLAPWIPVARMNHSATLLASGEVLVLGGYSSRLDAAIDDASVFDPVNRTWRTVQPIPERRMQHTATLLNDGRVLVAGGTDRPFFAGGTESYLYDPESNSWSAPLPMVCSRRGHSATKLRSGRVLVVGDSSDVSAAYSSEVFNPVFNQWVVSAELDTGRHSHTASLLSSGQVLVVAGGRVTSHPAYLASAELYTEQ